MAFSMVVIDLTLNFLLIPRWYAQGSAWASFITQTLAGVVQVIMVAKIFKIQIFTWWRTIRLGLWLILTLGICVLIKHMDIHWLYAFGASLGVSLAGAVVLKLLPVFDWLRLMFPAYNTLIKRNGV
jgi:O-antigen/teichoic acid export membrane protein